MRSPVLLLPVSVLFLAACGGASPRCTTSGCPPTWVCDAVIGVCRMPAPAGLQGVSEADGGTGGGLIGGGQPPAHPCRGVPLEGRCVSSSVIEACVTPTGDTSPRVQ